MPQEIIGKPSGGFSGTDKNKALQGPSPVNNDHNTAMPKTDMQNAFPMAFPRAFVSPIDPQLALVFLTRVEVSVPSAQRTRNQT